MYSIVLSRAFTSLSPFLRLKTKKSRAIDLSSRMENRKKYNLYVTLVGRTLVRAEREEESK